MKRLSTILVACFIFAPLAFGQNSATRGAITGRITDPSGAVVPGATVTATNLSTQFKTVTTSHADGFYNFPLMRVGQYSLTVSHTGFRTVTVKSLVVQIGQTVTQNIRLEVGSLTQTVNVIGSSPLLRPSQATSSTVVNNSMIANLPLNGRRYTDFVLLTPNTNADGEFGLVSFGGQQGGGDSGYANGNGANSYTVDGANATSNYFGGARGRTRVPYVFGENAVREFQVSTSPYSAAYGGAGAGFINTVTKSGTDKFHGSAFYYNRNNSFVGANDAIDKASGLPRPLDLLQQFGASAGGPIAVQKAWFFFDYEQQRELDPISVVNPGQSSVNEASFFPAGTALPPLPLPNAPFPSPSSVSSPDPTSATYLQQVSNALHAIQSNLGVRARRRDDLSFFPKVDWQLDNADHLTFEYNYNRFSSPGGEITFNPVSFAGDEALSNNFVHDHHATIEWTRSLRANLLSNFHISFLRDDQIESPSGLVNPSFPSVYLFTPEFMELGNPSFSLGTTHEFQWELNEGINWTSGKHNFSFGVDYDHTHIADFFPGDFTGTYAFSNPENFALGHYAFYEQATGNAYFPFSFPYYGFYVEDHYQARKNLTLDLGLREDFQVYPQPQENPGFPLTGQFPNNYGRWAPRFGFAYNPLPHTVVRGGIGLFYEILDGINYENSVATNGLRESSTFTIFNSSNPPNAQTPTIIAPGFGDGPTFPNRITSPSFFAGSSNISLVDPGFKTPAILESNLEIEQQLSPSMSFSVGTMWSHGYHLIASSAYDMNLFPPAGTTQYCISAEVPVTTLGPTCSGPVVTGPNLDSGLLTEGKINPNFGQINALISPGVDNYNSLYAELQRRLANGLEGLVSYTYSKDMCRHGVDFYNQFNLANTSSPCLLDQRQRFSIAGVYEPQFHFSTGAARALLSNWMISTEMAFNSGRPYAALLNAAPSGNELNDSAFNESTSNTADGINASGPSPLIGLNPYYGPGIAEIDLGLARSFHVREHQTVTIEAEMFNVPNTANFYVQYGTGINQDQYNPVGTTCGDGTSVNQKCFLTPNSGPGGFGTLNSIDQLNGPRVMQFSLTYKF